ncbi:MAG: transaldolase family protein [Hyphomicrobiales bacterium]
MVRPSVLERLQEVQPLAELWWDSSPLVYDSWRRRMIAKAADAAEMSAWLDRLFHESRRPEDNLFRGVTTNPRLAFNAIKDRPEYWTGWIDDCIRENRGADAEFIAWEAYKEIARRGAAVFLPQFEASRRKYGFFSAQADPRLRHDADRMVTQGLELHGLSPNIMIKIPGTAEGYDAIRRLTARGVPTNNTVSLVISQVVACMEAVGRGLREAWAGGVDLSGWRSVITVMSSRFGTLGALQQEAEELGLDLSESDVRWAEIALIKRACQLIGENRDYPGKMLLSSMRISPVVDGYTRVWHLEKIAGADIVYTLPPSFLESLLFQAPDLEFSDQWAEPVPRHVLEKLLVIPYFEKGYREDGYSSGEFTTHPALLTTAREFSSATRQLVEFVAERIHGQEHL